MDTLLAFLLSNALVATVLALFVAAIGKVWRHPGLLHMLWLVVLLKLVTPPFVTVPINWATSNAAVTKVSELKSVNATTEDTQRRPMAEQSPEAIQSKAHLMHTRTSEVAVPSSAWNRSWQAWVIGGWLTGSVVFFVVLIRRVVAFQNLLATGAPASEAIVQQTCHLCRLLGLRTRPSILMLSGRLSPVVWPFSRTAIVVLPSELFERLDAKSRETILTHELAHLRRKDHWVRVLEIVETSFFWWHPVLWWARRQLHEAEEQCCDATVMRVLPDSTKSYASALIDTVDFLREIRNALPIATTGARASVHLSRRIEMLTQGKLTSALTARHVVFAGLIAMVALPVALVAQDLSKESGTNNEQGEAAVEKLDNEELSGVGTVQTSEKPEVPSSETGKVIRIHANVVASYDVQIASPSSAVIRSVEVTPGQKVEKGELLAQADDQLARLEVQKAQVSYTAALEESRSDADVRYAEVAKKYAEEELARLVKLTEQNLVSNSELRRYEAKVSELDAQIGKAKSLLRSAQQAAQAKRVELMAAELRLSNYSVRAPVSGQIVEVYARPGQWVAVGERVCRIVNMEKLRIEAFLSPNEFDAEELSGREVTVEVMRARGRIVEVPGKIVFVSPLVEPASGVYRVWVEVENRRTDGHWLLRPGAVVTLHLSRD